MCRWMVGCQSVIKKRREKEERLASVRAGREGREFMAKRALKQKKVSFKGGSKGLTNRAHSNVFEEASCVW